MHKTLIKRSGVGWEGDSSIPSRHGPSGAWTASFFLRSAHFISPFVVMAEDVFVFRQHQWFFVHSFSLCLPPPLPPSFILPTFMSLFRSVLLIPLFFVSLFLPYLSLSYFFLPSLYVMICFCRFLYPFLQLSLRYVNLTMKIQHFCLTPSEKWNEKARQPI